MLKILLLVNLIGLIILVFIPSRFARFTQYFTILISGSLFIISLVMWVLFENGVVQYQFLVIVPWFSHFNIHLLIGIDSLSLFFILITTLIFPFCIMASFNLQQGRLLSVSLVAIELCLLLTFSVLDLFLFCLFFESLLIPMFILILAWGTRERRVKALSYFYVYTLFGSIFIMIAIFILYFETQSTSFFVLGTHDFKFSKKVAIWLLLFAVFAIKIPIFPFHIWLPEAHVEAPTLGSVILAGLLLKLGAYGILRFLFILDGGRYFYQPFLVMVCILSIFYASFMATRQLDLKRIIAYSSVAHMNFALLGYFSNNIYGLVGGLLLMISHAIVSAALFFLVGVTYERHHTRIIYYYGGLVQIMPLFGIFCFLFIISNFSFPGTSNFVGEILVLISLGVSAQKFILILAGLSTFFTLVYSIFLFNRVIFGNIKTQFINLYIDIKRHDFYIITYLMFLNLIMGLMPNSLITAVYLGISNLTRYAVSYNVSLSLTSFVQESATAKITPVTLAQAEPKLGAWLKQEVTTPYEARTQYHNWLINNKDLQQFMDFDVWKEFSDWLFYCNWLDYQEWLLLNGDNQFVDWVNYLDWTQKNSELALQFDFDMWRDLIQWKHQYQMLGYVEYLKENPDTRYEDWVEYSKWIEKKENPYMDFNVWEEFMHWKYEELRLEWLSAHPSTLEEQKVKYEEWKYTKPELCQYMPFDVWIEFINWQCSWTWVEYQIWLDDKTHAYMDFDVWQEFKQWEFEYQLEAYNVRLKEHPDTSYEDWVEYYKWLENKENPYIDFDTWQEFKQWEFDYYNMEYDAWLQIHPDKQFDQWLEYELWVQQHPDLQKDMNFSVWQEFLQWTSDYRLQQFEEYVKIHPTANYSLWVKYHNWSETNPDIAQYMSFDVWEQFVSWLFYCDWAEYSQWLKDNSTVNMDFDVWQEFMAWKSNMQKETFHVWLKENPNTRYEDWVVYYEWIEKKENPYMDFNVWEEFMHWKYEELRLEWLSAHPSTLEEQKVKYEEWKHTKPELCQYMPFDVWIEFINWQCSWDWVEYQIWLDDKTHAYMDFDVWQEFKQWEFEYQLEAYNVRLKEHPDTSYEDWVEYYKWLENKENPYIDFDTWQEFKQWEFEYTWLIYEEWIKAHPEFLLMIYNSD